MSVGARVSSSPLRCDAALASRSRVVPIDLDQELKELFDDVLNKDRRSQADAAGVSRQQRFGQPIFTTLAGVAAK